MKTYLECLPCFVRQAIDAVRMAGLDESVQTDVVRTVVREMSELDFSISPPVMGRRIQRIVREASGKSDLFRDLKKQSNRIAMSVNPEVQELIRKAPDPLEMAVRMAIAGNIIDFGMGLQVGEDSIRETLERALTTELNGDLDAFVRDATEAESILYLADNAGEIVFDRNLIEQLGPQRVTLAVKGSPILNDALREDAEATGLADIVEVIDNGSDAPGTILEECDPEFVSRFNDADVVIAKGQGNYETLSEAPRPVWFILMAKCKVVARHIGCEPGSFVLRRRDT